MTTIPATPNTDDVTVDSAVAALMRSGDADRTLTKERVFAICEALQADGKPVTQTSIYNANNRKGSNSTIIKHLHAWQEQRTAPAQKAPELPASVSNSLMDYINREISAALATAHATIAELRKEVTALLGDNEEQAGTIANQAQALEAVDTLTKTQSGRIEQLSTALEEERAAVQREREAAETARRQLATADLRLESLPRLEAEKTELRAKLDEANAKIAKAEQDAAVMHERLAGADKRAAEAREAQQKGEASLAEITSQIARIRDDAAAEAAKLREQLAAQVSKTHDAEMRALKAEGAAQRLAAIEKTPATAGKTKKDGAIAQHQE